MTGKRIIILAGVLMISLLLTAWAVVSVNAMRPVLIEDSLPQIEKLQQDEDYGMGKKQRYHQIHKAEDLDCEDCHTAELSPREAIFFAQDVSPDAPDPVDRNTCLFCHEGTDAEKPLYGVEMP